MSKRPIFVGFHANGVDYDHAPGNVKPLQHIGSFAGGMRALELLRTLPSCCCPSYGVSRLAPR